MPTPPKHCPQFALLIETPDIAQLRLQFLAEDLPRLCPHVQVAGCEDDFVGFEF